MVIFGFRGRFRIECVGGGREENEKVGTARSKSVSKCARRPPAQRRPCNVIIVNSLKFCEMNFDKELTYPE